MFTTFIHHIIIKCIIIKVYYYISWGFGGLAKIYFKLITMIKINSIIKYIINIYIYYLYYIF